MGQRFSFIALLLSFMLVVAGLPQRGGATGIINLPRTGQTASYAAGDDGNLQKGVAWPATRFVEDVTGTVPDTLTGLVWAKDAGTPTAGPCAGGRKSWQGSLDYVACLNSSSYLDFSDWRLPTIVELQSLFNDGASSNATWLTGQGFANVQTSYSYYWSSTTFAGSQDLAWNVNLRDSKPEYATGSKTGSTFYVLPVRGTTSEPARLRRSGQTLSYAAGDDGQLEPGVAWPEPRFTADATAQCLADGLTGLVWVRYPLPTLGTWQEALEYSNSLNLCGYTDWRLPNRQELRSLVDYGETLTASYLNETAFGGVKSREYWTSTSYAPATGSAWGVELGSGGDKTLSKTGRYSTLAVRSGTAPAPTGHALSGRISSGGVALAGVTISLSGPLNQVTQTDGNGNYAFANLPDGSYTLTPARNHYSFTPTQLAAAISGANTLGKDFAATLSPYGWVDLSDNLSGLAGKATLSGMSWISADEGWIASGAVGEIYHTIDGGRTFTIQTNQYNTPINVIQMLNANEGYAGGNSRLYRTVNGGTDWSYIGSCGNVRALSFAPGSATGYCGSDNGSILSITGNTLTHMSSGTSNTISGISAVAANRAWAVWWQSVLFYNGSNWVDQDSSFDSNLPISLQNIQMVNEQIGWVVGAYGLIAKTTTGGEVVNDMTPWTGQPNPDPSQRALNDVFFQNTSEGWTVGNGGVILHTSNGGATWNLEADGTTANMLRSVRFTSPTNGYVLGNNGTLLKYTSLPQPPTVTTSAVSNITATMAVSGGNVTSDGQGAVSARGVCWGTTANPTTTDSCSGDGTGPGHFASNITGLSPLTTYFVRAFASNTAGTGYGDNVYFTTPCPDYVAKIGTSGYGTLQNAINNALGTVEIRAVAKELTEVLSISGDKALTLRGGYDCVCTEVTGFTTVHGSLTIGGNASVVASNIALY